MHHPSVLFVCTGNVYRSRFAEAFFNHLASERKLPLRAASRGIAPHTALEDSISPYAEVALRSMGISLQHTSVTKTKLTEEDFERARHVIALSHTEHRPLMVRLYPTWIERVTFWDVEDVQRCEPERAMDRIVSYVEELVRSLGAQTQQVEGDTEPSPATGAQ